MTKIKKLSKEKMQYKMAKGKIEFTLEDHKTWSLLFERQLKLTANWPCKEWLEGFERLKLDPNHVPNLEETSRRIQKFTGWKIMNAENEFLNNDEWFAALVKKEFPATNFIRKLSELDFTPYPDLFHEYFGHLPFMTVPIMAEITHLFGKAYFATPKHLRVGVGRLWWHAMEWSFVKEVNNEKVLGAGLIAGKNDLLDGISKKKIPFSVEEAFTSHKTLSSVQEKYFIIDSIKDLRKALKEYIKMQFENGISIRIPENFDRTEEIEEFKKRIEAEETAK